MKTSQRVLLWTTTVVLAAGFAAGWHGAIALRNQRAAIAMGTQQNAALSEHVKNAELKFTALKQASRERSGRAPVAAPVPIKGKKKATTAAASSEEILANDPRLQTIYFRAKRGERSAVYTPLFRQLRLTTVQTEALKDLLMKQEENQNDLAAIKKAQGLNAKDPALVKVQAEAEAELHRQELEILGAADYEKFQDYKRKLPAREFVGKLAGAAAVAGVPLSPEQANELVDAIAESSPHYRQGYLLNASDVVWGDVDKKATSLLTPDQLWFLTHAEPPDIRGFSRYSSLDFEINKTLYDASPPSPR